MRAVRRTGLPHTARAQVTAHADTPDAPASVSRERRPPCPPVLPLLEFML